MHHSKLLYAFAILLTFLVSSSFRSIERGSLEVTIDGLRNNDGQFMISLSKGPEGFPNKNYFEQRFIQEFTSPRFKVIFEDIPYGNYALGVLHDEDKNGKMTSNFIGMPKEGFGFYRHFEVSLRAPKYEEVSFDFESSSMKVQMQMQY